MSFFHFRAQVRNCSKKSEGQKGYGIETEIQNPDRFPVGDAHTDPVIYCHILRFPAQQDGKGKSTCGGRKRERRDPDLCAGYGI